MHARKLWCCAILHCPRYAAGMKICIVKNSLVQQRRTFLRAFTIEDSRHYKTGDNFRTMSDSYHHQSLSQRISLTKACVNSHTNLSNKSNGLYTIGVDVQKSQVTHKMGCLNAYALHGRSNAMHLSSSSILSCSHLSKQVMLNVDANQRRHYSDNSWSRYLSSDFGPVGYAHEVLDQMNTWTGLPWWATIIATTVTLRTVITLPLAVYSSFILARVEKLNPEILGLSRQLKMEVASAAKRYEWDQKAARHHFNFSMKRLMKNLYIRDNCHPAKASLVMWFQIPMWLSMSFALRNMAGAGLVRDGTGLIEELSTGGAFWFSNLLVPDPTLILPVSVALLNLTITEMYALRRNPTRFQRYLTNFMRCISIALIPIGAYMPACMTLYWSVSSLYGLLQNVLLRLPSVRASLRIPATPSQSDTPLRDMYAIAKDKYRWKRRNRDSDDKT